MIATSAAVKVERPTPTAKFNMSGSGRPLRVASNSDVMPVTAALERACSPRASKTGKDGEMRIVIDGSSAAWGAHKWVQYRRVNLDQETRHVRQENLWRITIS
jgi:hypothetical protein